MQSKLSLADIAQKNITSRGLVNLQISPTQCTIFCIFLNRYLCIHLSSEFGFESSKYVIRKYIFCCLPSQIFANEQMKPLYLFLYLCLYLLFPVGPLFVVQMQNRNHIIDFKFHRCPHSFHQFYCESLKICTYVEFCTYMHNAQLHNGQEEMLHKISQILSFVVGGEIALKIAIFRILCLCVGG